MKIRRVVGLRKAVCLFISILMVTTIFLVEIPQDVGAQVVQEWVAVYDGGGEAQTIAIDPFTGGIFVTGLGGTVMHKSSSGYWWHRYPGCTIDIEFGLFDGNYYEAQSSPGTGTGDDFITVRYEDYVFEWSARYNGPGNGDDKPQAMVVDSLENVYVIGYSDGGSTDLDYATIKYDSDGNQLWVARYDSIGNGRDIAYDLILDSSDKLFVTGGENLLSGGDYATVAYDSSGNELWLARYNGPGNSFDKAHKLALDGSTGNIYVTGVSTGMGTGLDYATVAYDSLGNQLWVARYNGPGNAEDQAMDIALDSAGNVYVTGFSTGSGADFDYATIAYDSSGNQLWVARYNGPGNWDDQACGLAVDKSTGNIYNTGKSWGGSNYDYATVAYNSLGSEIWVARYNGPADYQDYARDIIVDTSGFVYITGLSWDPITGDDYMTIKYDDLGNVLWAERFNPVGGNARAMDINLLSGNLFVTGSGGTVAYDSFGNELWRARGYGTDIVVNQLSGNVYVTGIAFGTGTHYFGDYATFAYDALGNRLWMALYDGPANAEDWADSIALDESSGNVYVTGFSNGGGTDWDYATVAYKQNGNELWVARYDSQGNGRDRARDIAVDSNGNVYVTGYEDLLGVEDYVTVAYDSSGNQLWVAKYNGHGISDDQAIAIATDAFNNIYVTGRSGLDYATIKYDSSGNELWVIRYENGSGYPSDMIIDDISNNIYITGTILNNGTTGMDYMTVSYDSSGNELWTAIYFGPGYHSPGGHSTSDITSAITLDTSGNIYITGGSPSSTHHDYATVAYDSFGHELWVTRYNSPNYRSDRGVDVVTDPHGNIYVTGRCFRNRTGWAGTDYHTIKYIPEPTNQPPIADLYGPYTVSEGESTIVYAPNSYDPDGDPIQFKWDFNNDGIWDTGWNDYPFELPTYGDDYDGEVVLLVTDGKNFGKDSAQITVSNVAPTIDADASFTTDVELGLRVAGRKYNDVAMTIYEDGNPAGYISVERTPGSPDDQMVGIPIKIDQSKTYTANVTFTPEDPPNKGANPVWIYIKRANGSIDKIHHTFNVQQSKKRDSQHWNHIEPWELDLDDYLTGGQIEVTTRVTDPGSDDIFITYSYGSQVVNVTFLNNPPNPDPYPSPDGNQVDIIDTVKLNYEGPGLLTVTAEDDDGGITTQTLYIA